jgi:UrcA family protein
MFTPILMLLASAATPPQAEPITVFDDAPSIVIPLARYDLARSDDVRHLKLRIIGAARLICESGYRGLAYRETIACVKSAVSGGNAQLGRLLAHNPSSAPLATAIAVSAPAN